MKAGKIKQILKSIPTIEGAGVNLNRVFGHNEVRLLDPFLLLDDFSSNNPKDYIAGFPWHPHRGIETVTYIISGKVEHKDSIGNKGAIKSGDIQWMTAGSGIIHEEMPKKYLSMMQGFQLWVNLPAKNKMMKPRYRGITKDEIPKVITDEAEVKIISGIYKGKKGPVKDIIVDIDYFDVSISSGKEFRHKAKQGYTTFAYIYKGKAIVDKKEIDSGNLVLFSNPEINIKGNVKFLFLSGKPIKEPIAWYGPIVMNTQKELEIAFEEYRNGNFVK